MLDQKQNVFDDFIAAATYLVDQRYTRPERLAIMGGSNGGLLVGAALTQRPDLFRAVICTFPLLDMIRFHKFLQGPTWVSEYGSAEDPAQFKTLLAYSPYHHIKPGTRYPAVLFVTGDADTRVAPLHARKMTALLQADGPNPERGAYFHPCVAPDFVGRETKSNLTSRPPSLAGNEVSELSFAGTNRRQRLRLLSPRRGEQERGLRQSIFIPSWEKISRFCRNFSAFTETSSRSQKFSCFHGDRFSVTENASLSQKFNFCHRKLSAVTENNFPSEKSLRADEKRISITAILPLSQKRHFGEGMLTSSSSEENMTKGIISMPS
jgi:hypothetical protein